MVDITTLQDEIAALEASLEGSAGMVAAFDGELLRMRDTLLFTGKEVNTLSAGIGGGLRRAFDGLVFDGGKLSDALKSVGQSIADTIYGIAIKPVQSAIGGFLANGLNSLLGGAAFADGAAFSQGRVMPFAKNPPIALCTGLIAMP